jgi:hypothetical protein
LAKGRGEETASDPQPAGTTDLTVLGGTSAEGAAFNHSLGQRPRVMKIEKTLALKARFTSGTPVGSAPIESRFLR